MAILDGHKEIVAHEKFQQLLHKKWGQRDKIHYGDDIRLVKASPVKKKRIYEGVNIFVGGGNLKTNLIVISFFTPESNKYYLLNFKKRAGGRFLKMVECNIPLQ